MAKQDDNIVMRKTQGAVGKQVVFKIRNGKSFVSKYPDMSGIIPSKTQIKSRKKFAAAISYAKSVIKSPSKKITYEIKPGKSVYHTAIKDFMNLHKPKSTERSELFEGIRDQLIAAGLNDRQLKALLYIFQHSVLTNALYRHINGVSKATATRDLQILSELDMVKASGIRGAGAQYEMGSWVDNHGLKS